MYFIMQDSGSLKEAFDSDLCLLDYYQQQLENAIRPDTSLVSVMTVNNEIGVTQPMKEIGKTLCQLMITGIIFLFPNFIQTLYTYIPSWACLC